MTTPTQVKLDLREKEVERVNDDVKRRISELQLKILSGTLTSSELDEASAKLAEARKALVTRIDSTLKEQTGRRVRAEEEKRQQTA